MFTTIRVSGGTALGPFNSASGVCAGDGVSFGLGVSRGGEVPTRDEFSLVDKPGPVSLTSQLQKVILSEMIAEIREILIIMLRVLTRYSFRRNAVNHEIESCQSSVLAA